MTTTATMDTTPTMESTPTDRRMSERRAQRGAFTAGEARRSEERRSEERRRNERRALVRRRCPRIHTELWAEELRGEACYFRRVANLSEGGLFFDVALPIDIGASVTLRLKLPGDASSVEARGRVARVGTGHGLGMGIAFTSFEGDGRQRVSEYVRTVAAAF